jgi:hypothetical protein
MRKEREVIDMARSAVNFLADKIYAPARDVFAIFAQPLRPLRQSVVFHRDG